MSVPGSATAATEVAWERLWPQLALRQGFWIGFIFGADLTIVRELESRAANVLRARARGVESRYASDPEDLPTLLRWVLAGVPVAAGLVWVVGVAGGRQEWATAWREFLQRLNEQRDFLRKAVPAGIVLVLPPGLLPMARDAAPDLWSYRTMSLDLPQVSPRPVASIPKPGSGRPDNRDETPFAELALAPMVEPSAALGSLLQQVAADVQTGRGGQAVPTAVHALETAASSHDNALATAWLAMALDGRGDLAAALPNARSALDAGYSLGLSLTHHLLEIAARAPNLDIVEEARQRQTAIARLVLDRYGETPEALRDLSVSLNNVAGVQRTRGQLDDALAAAAEAVTWYERLEAGFGPPLADLDELARLRVNLEEILELLDGAR